MRVTAPPIINTRTLHKFLRIHLVPNCLLAQSHWQPYARQSHWQPHARHSHTDNHTQRTAFLTPVVMELGNGQWYYVHFLHTKLYPNRSKNFENMGKLSPHRTQDVATRCSLLLDTAAVLWRKKRNTPYDCNLVRKERIRAYRGITVLCWVTALVKVQIYIHKYIYRSK
jgi:hypothetical protein